MKHLHFFRLPAATGMILLLALFAPALFSQSATGKVVGTVTDPSGAAIAGAGVTVINVATRAEKTATSGPEGRYEVRAAMRFWSCQSGITPST
jgi:hypothetical protein